LIQQPTSNVDGRDGKGTCYKEEKGIAMPDKKLHYTTINPSDKEKQIENDEGNSKTKFINHNKRSPTRYLLPYSYLTAKSVN
jgi:hypothetical protein